MLRTVTDRPTDYWNDSCAVDELEYAVARGATGATSNPSIVLEVLRKERAHWVPRIAELAAADPSWTETDITWAVIEEMAVRGAGVLEPVFGREGGRKGRLSLQTNPANYPNAERMLEQGIRFAGLAPNMQVKFPATRAGIEAIEAATAAGVSINATVCFTVAAGDRGRRGRRARPRCVRRARRRRRRRSTPVCTLMIGRLDDWMRVLVERDDIAVHPDAAGLGRDRGLQAGVRAVPRARLSDAAAGRGVPASAALDRARRRRRHPDDAARLAGAVQRERHHARVADRRAGRPGDRPASCSSAIPDFARAYEPDGLDDRRVRRRSAPTVRTLRGFIKSYHDLIGAVRDVVLPDPDVRPA